MKKSAFEVALKGKKQIAEGTYAFVFEKPEGFFFRAGQHIRMTLINPPETDSEGNSRFFSLANSPQETDLVFAMRMRDTAFKRVLKCMQVKDKALIEILLEIPHGSFLLHDDASKPAIFLIGGIGIVPAFSMIKDAIERKLPHKIFLFYSNRRPEDAPFLDDLVELAKQNPALKLIATMTEPEKSAETWRGETGFINRAMLARHASNLQSSIYYIAGLPEMVSAMQKVLAESDAPEDNIRAEEFAGFKIDHGNDVRSRSRKQHVPLVAIALAVIVLVIVHVSAAVSIYHSGFDIFSFKNPLLYLMVGLLLVVGAFKFKHLKVYKLSQKKK